MQLGMVGLGRMGGNIVRRLLRNGHTAVVFDQDPKAVAALVQEGAVGADSLDDFVAKLEAPRTAWVMLPAGDPTEVTVMHIAGLMQPGPDGPIFMINLLKFKAQAELEDMRTGADLDAKLQAAGLLPGHSSADDILARLSQPKDAAPRLSDGTRDGGTIGRD